MTDFVRPVPLTLPDCDGVLVEILVSDPVQDTSEFQLEQMLRLDTISRRPPPTSAAQWQRFVLSQKKLWLLANQILHGDVTLPEVERRQRRGLLAKAAQRTASHTS